jgi:hypothetical protein
MKITVQELRSARACREGLAAFEAFCHDDIDTERGLSGEIIENEHLHRYLGWLQEHFGIALDARFMAFDGTCFSRFQCDEGSFKDAAFRNVSMAKCCFTGIPFDETTWMMCSVSDSSFWKTTWRMAFMEHTTFHNTCFKNCDFTTSSFAETFFVECSFYGCKGADNVAECATFFNCGGGPECTTNRQIIPF